ncbi:16351_t:CDS:2, partial [Cetraspora pellucida]
QTSQIQSWTLEDQQQDLQILFSKALEPITPQPNHDSTFASKIQALTKVLYHQQRREG